MGERARRLRAVTARIRAIEAEVEATHGPRHFPERTRLAASLGLLRGVQANLVRVETAAAKKRLTGVSKRDMMDAG